ncbi:MAG: hypothetical protein JRH18_00415 [Deltaproteobacteria bacterium]|nr:hypothetical protein [Deltaproteobacteria bacterium]
MTPKINDPLFTSPSSTLKKLPKNRLCTTGDINMIGRLLTWQRGMVYHPMPTLIVPSGRLSFGRSKWLPSNTDIFVPVEALSLILRAKFRSVLKKPDLFDSVPADLWQKDLGFIANR